MNSTRSVFTHSTLLSKVRGIFRVSTQGMDKPDTMPLADCLMSGLALFSLKYPLQEEYVYMNPVALIRQKSKFIRKNPGTIRIRRLSDRQWHYVMKTVQEMAQ